MGGNTAEIRVGRLLEVRVDDGYQKVQDVDALFARIASALKALPPGTKHVTIVDWRRCPIMSPACADYAVQRIAGVNDTTERSATVAPMDAPSTVLQFARMIRDSRHPFRKMFSEEDMAIEWLGEVLTVEERHRLRRFVSRT